MTPLGKTRALGSVAILFYAVHGAYHWQQGLPENMLWACHLGALLVGLGLLLDSANLNGVGFLWLSFGTCMWLVGLTMDVPFLPTSALTHVGGLAIGLWGVRRLGLPTGVAWKAVAGLGLLHLISRGLNPPGKNINMAREIASGLEGWFPSHAMFLLAIGACSAAAFVSLEMALRRAFPRSSEKADRQSNPRGLCARVVAAVESWCSPSGKGG